MTYIELERCVSCGVRYPSDILYFATCGICALIISNRELGVSREKFDGEIAEQSRQDAINWRKYKGKNL